MAKKQFLSARPIISYAGFTFEVLFKALAMTLRQLMREVLHCSHGLKDMPDIFQDLHVFLQSLPEDSEIATFKLVFSHPSL